MVARGRFSRGRSDAPVCGEPSADARSDTETMQQSFRRSCVSHRSPTSHRSLMGSLLESLWESLEESRRRATHTDEKARRGSWFWAVGLLVAGGTLALAAPAGAVLPIDDFSSAQTLELTDPSDFTANVAPAPAAIGGERDLQLERLSGAGGAIVDVNGGIPPQGQLLFSSDIGTSTVLRLVWDGEDNDAEEIDFDGLGSMDLSDGGLLDAFSIELDSDLETTLSLRVYDASDPTGQSWSGATVAVLPTGGQFEILEVLFTELDESGPLGAVDFTNVGAIHLEVAGVPSLDFRLTAVQVVPEPAAASLAGLFTLALLARQRRRGGS